MNVPVIGLTFELAPWGGGFVMPGQYGSIPGQVVQGRFKDLSALMMLAETVNNPNLLKVAGSAVPIGPTGVSSASTHSAGEFLNPAGSVAAAVSSDPTSGCCLWRFDVGSPGPTGLELSPIYEQASGEGYQAGGEGY